MGVIHPSAPIRLAARRSSSSGALASFGAWTRLHLRVVRAEKVDPADREVCAGGEMIEIVSMGPTYKRNSRANGLLPSRALPKRLDGLPGRRLSAASLPEPVGSGVAPGVAQASISAARHPDQWRNAGYRTAQCVEWAGQDRTCDLGIKVPCSTS